MSLRRPLIAAVATAVTAAALLGVAPGAQAAPTYPSGWRVAAVTGSSVTVTLNRIADKDVTSYRVAVSTVTSHLTTAYLTKHRFGSDHTAAARTNRITVGRLRYTTAPYYYRVGVTYGRYRNYVAWGSTISSGVGLRPAGPTTVTGHGTYLTWRAGSSTGAQIRLTDRGSGASRIYTVHNTTSIFSPYGLRAGRAYSFAVRALNVHTPSAWSATSATLTGRASTNLRIMSYNIMGAAYTSDTNDGRTVRLSGWLNRVGSAAALVEQVMPDVLTVQEGDAILGASGTSHVGNHAYPTHDWPGDWFSQRGVHYDARTTCNQAYTRTTARSDEEWRRYWPYRQVDSLCDYTNRAVGSQVYARAVDGTPDHNGSTDYLIYDTRTMRQLTLGDLGGSTDCWMSDDASDTLPAGTTPTRGCGGYFSLENDPRTVPTPRSAAWGAFEVKATGQRVLVVSPHTSAELGTGWDARRTTQVTNLITRTRAIAAALGIHDVVYAGDFNNYVGRPGLADSTTPVMKRYGYPDSIENAQTSVNTKYLSGNWYFRTPPTTPDKQPGYSCLDHVYVTPGIGVERFGEAMRLTSKGAFADTYIASDHNPVYVDLSLPS